jgi:hypothetical protein
MRCVLPFVIYIPMDMDWGLRSSKLRVDRKKKEVCQLWVLPTRWDLCSGIIMDSERQLIG